MKASDSTLTPKEKAAEIVQLWDRVAKAFGGQSSAWIKMLKIVAAGDTGLTTRDLIGPNTKRDGSWVRKATKAGLLESTPTAPCPCCGKGGRPANIIKVTKNGLRALGLES